MQYTVAMTLLLVVIGVPPARAQSVVFRAGVDLVDFSVTVTDRRGELVTDLTEDDFEVYDERQQQTIAYFATGTSREEEDLPLHLGLLFDTSGSMSEDLELSRSAAVKFLNALPAAESMTLVDFDTEVRVARYGQADFPRLVERIRMRKPDGWTALYDALGVYLDGAAAQVGKKVLVLYTDGGDTRSSITFSEAVDLLKLSDVTVYAIGFLDHQPGRDRIAQRQRLTRFAGLTGGMAFFPSRAEALDEVYEQIRREIEAQYSLGYLPADLEMNGHWRDVEIRIVRPDADQLKIRTRQGYFAPYREPNP